MTIANNSWGQADEDGSMAFNQGYTSRSRTYDRAVRDALDDDTGVPLTIVAGHQRVLVRDLMRLTGNEESVSLAAVAPPAPKRRSPGRPRKLATTVGAGHE